MEDASRARVLTLVVVVVAPACASLEPEASDRLSGCVGADADPRAT